jgi:hypothetical protein
MKKLILVAAAVLLGLGSARADEAKLKVRFCVKPRNTKAFVPKGTAIALRADLILQGDGTVMRGGQNGASFTVYADVKVKKGDWQCSTVRVGQEYDMTPFVAALADQKANGGQASKVARAENVRGEWDAMTAYPEGSVTVTFLSLEAKSEAECSQAKCEIRLYTMLDTAAPPSK